MGRRRAWEAGWAPMPADLGGRRGGGGHGDVPEAHWAAKRFSVSLAAATGPSTGSGTGRET